MIKLLLLMLPLLLMACGSAPVQRKPPAIEQAGSADKDARRALRDGDLQRAQHEFARVLVLQQSLDDTAGAATTLVNLATTAHQSNEDTAALDWLDKILLEQESIYPTEARITAAFRKAVILTDLSRTSEAETSLQSAEVLCSKRCALSPGIDALRARLMLLKGQAEGALELAQAVSKDSSAGNEEQANALRIAAMAEEKLARPVDALQNYEAALEKDKALGLGARIGEDLNGMARVSARLGRQQEAAGYARRAELVTEAYHQTAFHHE